MKNDDANDGLDNFKNYFNSLKGELSKIKDYLQDTSQHIEVGTSSEVSVFQERVTECHEAMKMLKENVQQNI